MTKKLTSLTKKQTEAMPKYVTKWVDIGLSTEPVDFEKAKCLVAKAYTAVGLPEPKKYHFAKGPDEGFKIFKKRSGNKSRSDYTAGCMFGSMEASWLSYYDYYRNETNIELTDISYMQELARNCGWVYCGETEVIIHDRPEVIKFDDRRLSHCETGPAIRYRDGFEIYSWHGLTIPDEWIKDRKSLTAKVALGQTNAELRRAACEILGWANVIDQLDSVVIDEDADEMIGTLLEVNIPDIGKEKFLFVKCGTGRNFALPVPPDMKTALEANSWTFGLPNPNDLRDLEVRT